MGKKVKMEEYVELRRELELLRERQRAGVEGVDVVLTPTSRFCLRCWRNLPERRLAGWS